MYNGSHATIERSCLIYTLTGALETRIELQQCTHCDPVRRRHIGPDARELGLFNFNNRILFTHDLLEEYMSAYTTSETPFTAYVMELSRRYTNYESIKPFVSEEMFRAVWFTFVQLVRLEGDMTCPTCGPSPEDVIWDGVTLAFSRKHLLSSLKPPTTLSTNSPVRSNARYDPRQQFIPDLKLRRMVRKAVTGRSLQPLLPRDEDDEDDEEGVPAFADPQVLTAKAAAKRKAAAVAALAHITLIGEVKKMLVYLDAALAQIFDENFGVDVFMSKQSVAGSGVYRDLFLQVSVGLHRVTVLE